MPVGVHTTRISPEAADAAAEAAADALEKGMTPEEAAEAAEAAANAALYKTDKLPAGPPADELH